MTFPNLLGPSQCMPKKKKKLSFHSYIYIYSSHCYTNMLHKYSSEILKFCSEYIKRSLDTSQHGMKPNYYKTNNFINHIFLEGNNGRTVDDEVEVISKNDPIDVKLTSECSISPLLEN